MNTELTTKQPTTVKAWLAMPATKEQLAMALPRHISTDRFVRVAMTTLAMNPKLQDCTMQSVVVCLLKCAQYGIEPDGRRAHLIPYKDQCTLVFDYKGLAELVRRSGDVCYIHADVVREADVFDYVFGTGAFLKHKPSMKGRGEIICAYSFVKLKDGSEDFDVMAIEDIETIRDDKSQNYRNAKKNGYDNPWDSSFPEMAKKTVFRRHSKWLPLSPEVKGAIEADDEALTEQERFSHAKAAKIHLPTEAPEILTPQAASGGDEPEKSTAAESVNADTGTAQPPILILATLLKDSGITFDEFKAEARGHQMIPRNATSLEDMSDVNILKAIEQFDLFASAIKEGRKQEQAAP